jgi:hypothetical protein
MYTIRRDFSRYGHVRNHKREYDQLSYNAKTNGHVFSPNPIPT